MRWDYIIVGGGSAGCVLADRLSENENISVLLIEAGGGGDSLFVRAPSGIFFLKGKASHHWLVETTEDQTRDGRRETLTCGRGLGGGSAINGMVFVRGLEVDYKLWHDKAGALWSVDAITSAFDRVDDVIRAEPPRDVHPTADAFLNAARRSGFSAGRPDQWISSPSVMYCPNSAVAGYRQSTALTYLKRARTRTNLEVITKAQVEQIIFVGRTAVGIKYRKHGHVHEARANREVIVSCGGINTPQLLMLSGVGPADHLRDHGIPVVHDSPRVGDGLQDHPCIWISAYTSTPTWNNLITPWGIAKTGLQWLLNRGGPGGSGMCHITGFGCSEDGLTDPDFQFSVTPVGYKVLDHGVEFIKASAMTAAVSLSRPTGRGSVRLKTARANDDPVVSYNLLAGEEDAIRLANACRKIRQVYETSPLCDFIVSEAFPGSMVQNDADWQDYVRRHSVNMCHPVGSCRMGLDAEDVTDDRLRVRGVDNLRIVDASIMPFITSGNTNAPTIMIAERAAELIQEDQ